MREKHSEPKNANNDVLTAGNSQWVHRIVSADNDVKLIRKAAIKTKGGSGPSVMDADGWKTVLCSINLIQTQILE